MNYEKMSEEKLIVELNKLNEAYEKYKKMNLQLNVTRGKPSPEQLSLSKNLYKHVKYGKTADNTDVRNYGNLQGLLEMRKLFADILDTKDENIFIGGSSSLTMMYDTLAKAMIFGEKNSKKPWSQINGRKWICPVPGYDRHFSITDQFGFEMIAIPMLKDGPVMDLVEELVKDEKVLGMWCVPCYSNPDGIVYSKKVCERLAKMTTAAPDFRIYWDNAYIKHHLYINNKTCTIQNILYLAEKFGNPDRFYEFTSFSKITFAGSSVACMATNKDNMEWSIKHIKYQCIDCNKMNQYAHVTFFENEENVEEHMKKHADILRPKFELCLNTLQAELGSCKSCRWTKPYGGYFISFYTMHNTATDIWQKCKDIGVEFTKAGSCYPNGFNPADNHIRLAPSYASIKELEIAMKVLAICTKIVTINAILNSKVK